MDWHFDLFSQVFPCETQFRKFHEVFDSHQAGLTKLISFAILCGSFNLKYKDKIGTQAGSFSSGGKYNKRPRWPCEKSNSTVLEVLDSILARENNRSISAGARGGTREYMFPIVVG